MNIEVREKDGRKYQAVVMDGAEVATYNMNASLCIVGTADRRNSATAQLVPGVEVNGKYIDLLA